MEAQDIITGELNTTTEAQHVINYSRKDSYDAPQVLGKTH